MNPSERLNRAIELERTLIESIPETAANASILAARYDQLGSVLARRPVPGG